MTVLYFAYGSCMSPGELERDVPDYIVVGPAVVRGFRLGFTRYSRNRRGGVADLVPDIDARAEGVLYRLPRTVLPALDEREGAPDHYRRDFIAVRTVDGKIHDRVLTYVVVRKGPSDIPPHPDYASAVLAGAEAFLSSGYVAEVRTLIEGLVEAKGDDEVRRRVQARNDGPERRPRTHRSRRRGRGPSP